jgi:hypothetical protein
MNEFDGLQCNELKEKWQSRPGSVPFKIQRRDAAATLIHELTYSRHLNRKDELNASDRARQSVFLCDPCVLLWLNQLTELG